MWTNPWVTNPILRRQLAARLKSLKHMRHVRCESVKAFQTRGRDDLAVTHQHEVNQIQIEMHIYRRAFKDMHVAQMIASKTPFWEVKAFTVFVANQPMYMVKRDFYGPGALAEAVKVYLSFKERPLLYDAGYLYRMEWERASDVVAQKTEDRWESKAFLERAYADNYPGSFDDDNEEDHQDDWWD